MRIVLETMWIDVWKEVHGRLRVSGFRQDRVSGLVTFMELPWDGFRFFELEDS